MSKLSPKVLTIVAATAAAGFSGAAISGAASSSSSSTAAATTSTATSPKPRTGGPGGGETALTGETKAKVEKAALAKVPGTVVRTETDAGGVYESHIRKADGTEVEVKVGKDFEVTSVSAARAGGRGPGGRGRHEGRHADLTAVAKALGVTEAKLQSAVEAARPAPGTRKEKGAEGVAAIAKALGESTADVQAVVDTVRQDGGGRDGDRGRGPGGPGGPGRDPAALVAALVRTFSVSTAKAQAAVDAEHAARDTAHEARGDAFYAAAAKVLGKDAADVEKAFEAHRPARPATP